MTDPLADFLTDAGLVVNAAPLGTVPRDVLAPPASGERRFLLEIRRAAQSKKWLSVIAIAPADSTDPPPLRDVIWWLAADAWTLEQTGSNAAEWAASYGYSAQDPATILLFEQQAQQAAVLCAVLGEIDYRRLLRIYESSEGPQTSHED